MGWSWSSRIEIGQLHCQDQHDIPSGSRKHDAEQQAKTKSYVPSAVAKEKRDSDLIKILEILILEKDPDQAFKIIKTLPIEIFKNKRIC